MLRARSSSHAERDRVSLRRKPFDMARDHPTVLDMRRHIDALLARTFRDAQYNETCGDQHQPGDQQIIPRMSGRSRAAFPGKSPIQAVKREGQQKQQHVEQDAPDHVSPVALWAKGDAPLSRSDKLTIMAAVAPQMTCFSQAMA